MCLSENWNGETAGLSLVVAAPGSLPVGAEALRDVLRIYGIEVATVCDPECGMSAGGFIFSVGARDARATRHGPRMARDRRAREAHADSPIGRVFVEAHADWFYSLLEPAVFRTFQTLREADGAGDRLGDELGVAFRAVQARSACAGGTASAAGLKRGGLRTGGV